MSSAPSIPPISRRDVLRGLAGGVLGAGFFRPRRAPAAPAGVLNDVFCVRGIPDDPFYPEGGGDAHVGFDSLLHLMAGRDLKLYRSPRSADLAGPGGLIASDDVVLIKVNAQWKHRGCTNSDLVRGIVRRILGHPDGFTGEIVIFENGQGRGSLDCDTQPGYDDAAVHANANDERHSFTHLVESVFRDRRVSTFLLDPIRDRFIAAGDHVRDGYRTWENVSYPCFTTAAGNRVELREGLWRGSGHSSNLKLIDVPVLKHHDTGGSEITGAVKLVYGIVSMSDGQSGYRHYSGLGETCGKMMAAVARPVLHVLDAIWVSHDSLTGYPAHTTFRANTIAAGQDPVALDAWAARNILHAIDGNPRHHPDHPNIDRWLVRARDAINARGGLADPGRGIRVGLVTRDEAEMSIHTAAAGEFLTRTVLAASPAAVRFSLSAGASASPRKAMRIVGAGTFTWSVRPSAAWIACSPAGGTGPGVTWIAVNPSGLEAGAYEGSVAIESPEAVNTPLAVPVSLVLRSVPPRPDIRRNGGGWTER